MLRPLKFIFKQMAALVPCNMYKFTSQLNFAFWMWTTVLPSHTRAELRSHPDQLITEKHIFFSSSSDGCNASRTQIATMASGRRKKCGKPDSGTSRPKVFEIVRDTVESGICIFGAKTTTTDYKASRRKHVQRYGLRQLQQLVRQFQRSSNRFVFFFLLHFAFNSISIGKTAIVWHFRIGSNETKKINQFNRNWVEKNMVAVCFWRKKRKKAINANWMDLLLLRCRENAAVVPPHSVESVCGSSFVWYAIFVCR